MLLGLRLSTSWQSRIWMLLIFIIVLSSSSIALAEGPDRKHVAVVVDTVVVDTAAVDTVGVNSVNIGTSEVVPVDGIAVDPVTSRSDTTKLALVDVDLSWMGALELDTVEVAEPWQLDMEGRLSASQVSYRDWAEGGVNTLSLTLGTEGEAARTTPTWAQRYRTRLGFGVIQQDTLEVRKAEDRIRVENSLRYRGGTVFRYLDPTLTASVRTQFTAGFNYDEDPFDDDVERLLPVKVSDFMSPGNFRQSLGLTYEHGDWFEHRMAFAGQENVVVLSRLRPLYGLREDQMIRFQGGMESVTEVDRAVAENIRIRSNLNVFSAFDDFLDPDIIWENVLGMRVNEWLSVDLEVTAIYEPDVSSELQLKEVLSLGVSVVFI